MVSVIVYIVCLYLFIVGMVIGGLHMMKKFNIEL